MATCGKQCSRVARARGISLHYLQTGWTPYSPRSICEPIWLAGSRSAEPNVVFTTGKIFVRGFPSATGICAGPGLHA
jgi:hypothetical protein